MSIDETNKDIDKEFEKEIEDARAQFIEEEKQEEEKAPEEENIESFDSIKVSDEEIEKAFLEVEEKEEDKKIQDIPNISEYLSFTTGDVSDIGIELNKRYNKTEDNLDEILADQTNKVTKLAKIVYHNSNQSAFQARLLESQKESLKDINEIAPDRITRGKSFDERKDKKITGEEARINAIARLQGIKKIKLFNSGFHLIVRRLPSHELREVLKYIDEESKEIGMILGGHYYTVEDVLFKQKFMELLPFFVVDSNLKDWNQKDKLIKSINFLDFDTIIHGVTSLRFREGIKHQMVCPNFDCDYSEDIKLDLNKTKLIDTSKITEKGLKLLLDDSSFNHIKYQAYQKEINAFRVVEVNSETKIHLRTPTIYTYLLHSMNYVSKMIKALYSDNRTPSVQDLFEFRTINYYKQFIPWIEKVSFYDEAGTFLYETDELSVIEACLEKDMWENNKNLQEFISFFRDVVITHFGFLGEVCPVCEQLPNPKTNGFVPLDIKSFFFNLSVYQLEKDLSF